MLATLHFLSNSPFHLFLDSPKMNPDDTEVELEVCPICKKEFKDADNRYVSKLFKKGADTINQSSKKRGREDVFAKPGQNVHKQCRNTWTNEKEINRMLKQGQGTGSPLKRKSPRISMGPYNNIKDCLFCGQQITKGSH